jgi:nicotinamidase-related amidase
MQITFMIAGAVIVGLIAYTVWGMIRLQTPTKGPVIDRASRPGEALVVIDVQQDFTSEKTYPADAVTAVLSRINALASDAERQGVPVLNVRHVFKGPYVNFLVRSISGGRGGDRSRGLGPDPRLQLAEEADFVKHSGDAFSNPAFGRWLDDHNIGRLVIAGLDGNACVKSTADGALNRGYQVEIIDTAVLAQSAPSWIKQKTRLESRGAVFTT